MKLYQLLKEHVARHAYKRGQYKGSAPALKNQRWRNNFRIVPHLDDTIVVRLHNTDIITAYADGRFKIDCSGYASYQTTKLRLNEMFGFLEKYMSVGSIKKFGLSQLALYVGGQYFVYYDGMEFSAEQELLTELKPFRRKRTDRNETKEFHKELKESGFRDVFNVMWSQVTADDRCGTPRRLRDAVCNSECSNDWASIIATYSYTDSGRVKVDPPTAWARLMKDCKRDMYVLEETNIRVVSV